MYVIYPADELILMTYGFFAPRVKPRPTLDCLREPIVPIEYPNRAGNSNLNNSNNYNNNFSNNYSNNYNYNNYSNPAASAQPIAVPPRIPPTSLAAPTPPNSPHGNVVAFSFNDTLPPPSPISATPPRRTSRASLTHSNSNLTCGGTAAGGGSKRSSVRSNRSRPLTPLLPHQRALSTPMTYHEGNNPSAATPGRAPFQRSGAYDDREEEEELQEPYDRLTQLGAGSSSALLPRSRSPSIFLEPPTPDPTHAHFGPGWGRPMSPMDLPPERPTTSGSGSVGTGGGRKSPTTGKSRLRPKLHIPLGRLGRSSSSDTRERESSRLREDVHVHVENPVFSSENLRQNNFDAFFEAREPVIKLHPRTPSTAPPGSEGRGYSPPLERYAGVYDSPRARSPAGGAAGGLFARSPREERERALNARSRSADHWDEAAGGAGGAAAGAAAGGASSAGGGGAHSKGDRCPQKHFSHTL
ncbi:hypothetical protein KR222_001354, partial [Zaprionus bogoriensis]